MKALFNFLLLTFTTATLPSPRSMAAGGQYMHSGSACRTERFCRFRAMICTVVRAFRGDFRRQKKSASPLHDFCFATFDSSGDHIGRNRQNTRKRTLKQGCDPPPRQPTQDALHHTETCFVPRGGITYRRNGFCSDASAKQKTKN